MDITAYDQGSWLLASAEHTAAWTQRPWPRLAQALDGCGYALPWGYGALARRPVIRVEEVS